MGKHRVTRFHMSGQDNETIRDLIHIIDFVAANMANELVLRVQQQESSEKEALDKHVHSTKVKE